MIPAKREWPVFGGGGGYLPSRTVRKTSVKAARNITPSAMKTRGMCCSASGIRIVAKKNPPAELKIMKIAMNRPMTLPGITSVQK